MFSLAQKQLIAQKIEELLLSFDHPEMPKEQPYFTLHVRGKEHWSWANISPSWAFLHNKSDVNAWNESQDPVTGIKEEVSNV